MKNIFTVFVIALLTLMSFRCKGDDSPSSQGPKAHHFFNVTNAHEFNKIPAYDKTYNMLTVLPTDPSGSMMTLTFLKPIPPDSSNTVGVLQLPNDGYYTIKVYATDGSYIKWDNYYMTRDNKTGFWIYLYPDCRNYGSTTGFLSTAAEYYGGLGEHRNTSYHILDGSTCCDKNPQ